MARSIAYFVIHVPQRLRRAPRRLLFRCDGALEERRVLGGGVAKSGAFLLDAVRVEVPKYILYKELPYAHIELARLGADAGIIGAAMLS